MTSPTIKGVWVAMVTPWEEARGEPRRNVLRSLINRFSSAGVDGLFILGTTGEGFLLSPEERKRFAEAVLEEASGKSPIIVHVGHDRTKVAVELALHAKKLGAYAISISAPSRYSLDQRELENHFVEVANAVEDLPVLLYDIPSSTCNEIGATVLMRACEKAPNIVGAKVSRSDWEAWEGYLHAARSLTLLVGNDLLCLPLLLMGASGIVSGPANIMPELYVRLYQAVCASDITEARYWQKMIDQLCQAVHYGKPLAFIKEGVSSLGLDVGPVVRPLRNLDAHERQELERSLCVLRQGVCQEAKRR